MQRKSFLYLLAILALLVAMVPMGAAAHPATPTSGAAETVGNEQLPTARDGQLILAGPAAPAAPAANPEAILFDNGPLTTNPGAGAGGADASAVQSSLGNTLLGAGHQITANNRVADDFTVPAGGWNISTITFYAYQTGSTTTTTINNVNLQIWNGVPGAGGSSVVFGDTTTNRLAGSSFSNIYRVTDTTLTNNQRPIMADVVTVNTTLPAGTYWLDWQSGGTLSSGPWAPPVTILGQPGKPGANALQSVAGAAFATLIDTGNQSAQDLPFVIEGTPSGGPSISLAKTVGTTPGVCATTDSITVPQGTTVYYCYEVTNTGTVAFGLHTLTDDVLGTIFTGLSYTLAPGASVNTVQAGLSIPYVANATTTNTGTWLAYNATGGQSTATDTATVTVEPAAGGLVCNGAVEGFDNDVPPTGWSVQTTEPNGPQWTTIAGCGETGNFTNGSGGAACASSDVAGTAEFDTSLVTPMFSLAGVSAASLTYTANYQNFAGLDYLDVDISTNGGTTWTNLLSWNEDHGAFRATPGVNVSIDLSAYAGQSGLMLRYRYYDPNAEDYDWYAQIDNVGLNCTVGEPPNIDVAPLSMSSTQAPNTQVQQTLAVGNTGGADLIWAISEEPARPSTSPAAPTSNPNKLRAPDAVQRSAKELRDLVDSPTADVVQDGSFEAGTPSTFWTEASTNFGTPLCTVAGCGTGTGTGPLTGDWWAWFGGIAAYEAGSVSQSVTIPSGGPATLTFWVEQAVCSGNQTDYLEANIDGTQVWVTTATDPACDTLGYRQITVDVSAYANGAAHTLEFNSEISGTPEGTNFFLDDVVLDAGGGGGGACSNLSDVPWLSEVPANGTTAGGASTPVQVTFDSTGLAAGTYNANLCVDSNDPDPGPGNGTELVVVPVSLTVEGGQPPNINVSPLTLNSTQQPNTTTQQQLNVGNTGGSNLTWNLFEDTAAAPDTLVWSDNFDSYPSNSPLHGVGGWKGWFNDPAAGASTSTRIARSSPNSVDILGASDLVHEYSGYTSGQYVYTAWQYVPNEMQGVSYFILLNSYDDAGANTNWSTQVEFDAAQNLVINTGASGGQLPLVKAQWVEIRVEIDLTNDVQTFYYNNQMLYQGTWTGEVSGSGALNIGAVDLFANNASSVYYDDLSLTAGGEPTTCDAPSAIPWLSETPTNGTTAGGASTPVQVTFDSTGLAAGTYNANLCIESNDPDPGPGNGTELVIVPVELIVQGSAAITVAKTVGTVPGVCAATSSIDVVPGTTVYYCYTVTNTGDVTLNSHTLVDDQLGTIFTNFAYALTAGSSVNTVAAGLSIPAVINTTTTNVATWTAAQSSTGGLTATGTATATVNVASIEIAKTVGTVPGVCAATSNIDVAVGTTVYYCYTVTNTGDVTLNLHDLDDDVLGNLFTGFPYALTPGSSVSTVDAGLSIPYVANASTTNTATWTAYNANGPTVTATATATVTVGSIEVVKTVGTVPGVCAATSTITVPMGTTVYYCYTVTNTGDVTLNSHTLADDKLGTIFTNFAYALTPGSSVNTVQAGLSIPAVINVNTTNIATWTAAQSSTGGLSATATATARVNIITLICNDEGEGFDNGVPPLGWTVVSSIPGGPQWTTIAGCGELGNYASGNGDAACASGLNYPDGTFDTELRSPLFSLVGWTGGDLNFQLNFQSWAGIDRLTVDISPDGGTTWTTIRTYSSDQGTLQGLPGVNVNLDLTPWAGQPTLKLRWRYYSTASSPGWYAQVDEVKIKCSAPPPTAVSLASLSAATNSPLPVPAGLPVAALPAVASLALGAAYVLRRKVGK